MSAPTTNPFRVLHSKAKYLFDQEAKLTNEEKADHQWQLLLSVGGVQYIVGKGGVNTAFYIIGDNERVVCYPYELLDKIKSWSESGFASYMVVDTHYDPPRRKLAPTDDLEGILDKTPKPGYLIVGIKRDGKKQRLYLAKKTLSGAAWSKINAK